MLQVETGKIFNSVREAGEITGVHKENISSCCRRVPHVITAGGFHWRYV